MVRPAGRDPGSRRRSTACATLTAHPAFSLANPNRVRSLIGAFAQGNQTQFNRADGAGYDFVADTVLALDGAQSAGRRAHDDRVPQLARARTGAARPRRSGTCGGSPPPRRCRATSSDIVERSLGDT